MALSVACGLACCLLQPAYPVSPIANAASPVGHWVAEHPSKGGIGSWWDFHSGGTLTMYYGAMVTDPVNRSGDTLMMSSGTVGTPPTKVGFKADANTLYLTANGSELTYARVGAAPSAADPLVGTWKPVVSPQADDDPKAAALRKVKEAARYIFTADGRESVRIPFGVREGTWDAQKHTFKFPHDALEYSFELKDAKLVLGQPPDGKATDTYLRDTLL